MNELTSRTIQINDGGYCSQNRTPLPPIRNIEEGVRSINTLLQPDVLCQHDIEEINRTYQAIDLLEKKIDQVVGCSSQDALNKIIEKVKKIASDPFKAENLISLYHMQNFSDKDLVINKCFDSFHKNFPRSKESIKQVATHLPCCISTSEFKKDIQTLIGSEPALNVSKILDRKREKLQVYEKKIKEVQEKKLELEEKRKTTPENYPAYFDELLDNGYYHLFVHLIDMKGLGSRNDRGSEIEKMTFSELSHIVLETRKAVLQKVESSITVKQNILFLLGGSSAGKSTTLCFLRGDEMEIKGSRYVSKNDQTGLIGELSGTSCTFLPNVEIVNDLAIVDFPGFDDTNGQFISLGMELALKALINKYNPKILVLAPIVQEDNFAAIARHGKRLDRLLVNKTGCILGITKYSKDTDFGEIKKIEEEQKKTLLAPTEDEQDLSAEIRRLTKKHASEENKEKKEKYAEKIRTISQEMTEIQQKKMAKLKQPLPDTDQKKELRRSLKEKEDGLLKQIGLENILRFSDLNSSQLFSCLEALSNLSKEQAVQVNSLHRSSPDDKSLLDSLFEKNLMKELEDKKDYATEAKEFKIFEQMVLEFSLIKVMVSESNPEIGDLLHLPEIDPTIVQEYDNKIVSKCIKEYINSVIKKIDISLIKKALNQLENKENKKKIDDFKRHLNHLRDYIMGLTGSIPKDLEIADMEWNRLRKEREESTDIVDEKFKLANWAKSLFASIADMPHNIINFIKRNNTNQTLEPTPDKTITVNESIDACCKELRQIHDILIRLKDIEKIIQKREDINRAFNSMKISANSIDDLKTSIRNRINNIRNIYGCEDWDNRVSFLADKYLSAHIFLKDEVHISCLLAYAYLLIEPNLRYSCLEWSYFFNYPEEFRLIIAPQSSPLCIDDQKVIVKEGWFVVSGPGYAPTVPGSNKKIVRAVNKPSIMESGIVFENEILDKYEAPLLIRARRQLFS